MTDNMMPELTLTPDDTATAAAVEVPSLTLTPEAPEVPKEEEKKIEPVEMDDKLLSTNGVASAALSALPSAS